MARYVAGDTIEQLAGSFGIHRLTVSQHLKRAGACTRYRHSGTINLRRLRRSTPRLVIEAARGTLRSQSHYRAERVQENWLPDTSSAGNITKPHD